MENRFSNNFFLFDDIPTPTPVSSLTLDVDSLSSRSQSNMDISYQYNVDLFTDDAIHARDVINQQLEDDILALRQQSFLNQNNERLTVAEIIDDSMIGDNLLFESRQRISYKTSEDDVATHPVLWIVLFALALAFGVFLALGVKKLKGRFGKS